MTVEDDFNKFLDTAFEQANKLLIEGAREVLKECAGLGYYADVMGAQFFTSRSGKDVEYEHLPKLAQEFLDGIASKHLETFGSLGYFVYRDKLG